MQWLKIELPWFTGFVTIMCSITIAIVALAAGYVFFKRPDRVEQCFFYKNPYPTYNDRRIGNLISMGTLFVFSCVCLLAEIVVGIITYALKLYWSFSFLPFVIWFGGSFLFVLGFVIAVKIKFRNSKIENDSRTGKHKFDSEYFDKYSE